MSVASRSPPPGDEDLQHLYNEVWASFADEAGPDRAQASHNDQAADSLYSPYGSEHSPTSNSPRGLPANPRDSSRSLPYSRENVSSGRGPRPLPKPPGASSASSSSPAMSPALSMPDPNAYVDQPMLSSHMSHSSSSSYNSTDLRRKATTGTINRRLPQAPDGYNGIQKSPSVGPPKSAIPALPSDARSNYRNAQTPYTDSPYFSAGSPSYTSAQRPPGALPANIPGHDDAGSLGSSASNLYGHRPSMGVPNGYRGAEIYKQPAQRDYYPGPSSYPSSNGQAPSTSRLPSSNSLEEVHTAVQPPPSALYAPGPAGSLHGRGVPLGRTASANSDVSSFQNGYNDRKSSMATTASYDTSADTVLGRSSSFATTLDRGSSTGSYGSNATSSNLPYSKDYNREFEKRRYVEPGISAAESSNLARNRSIEIERAANKAKGPLELHEDDEDDLEYWEDDEEDDDSRFVNFSLLSHIAVRLRDKVPRGTHVKGSIPYPRAFTGKDVVSTVQSQIQRELLINHGVSTSDRRAALQVARSLQSQLFFYEVEWGGRILQDGVEDVYMFLDDQEGGHDAHPEREELPTGVITMLTKCYSPSCGEGAPCYSYACPRRGTSVIGPISQPEEVPINRPEWPETVESEVIRSLPESEINRQTIIHKVISKEEQYVQDLDTVESRFIKPLRTANPPILPPHILEDFIDDVFGNILDLRECNRRLLEVMYVRQREQAPVIQRIGDVFLTAAAEFRLAYPSYVGHHPIAEKRMKDEIENNPEFRIFLEHCSRQTARPGDSLRLDLKHFLNRPSEHLQKYPVLLEAILHETAEGNPDADYLQEAIQAIRNLQSVAQLRTFQTAMGKGPTGKWEWHDLVSPEIRQSLMKAESKRQSIIFELIKGEMAYVKDLENIELMYIRPLRNAESPIIPRDRLDSFIHDVFHNFAELHAHHKRLVDQFHEIQREEHPTIRSVTAAVFDAALNFRESYMEYVPNYPIAAYRIDNEMANNPAFKAFAEQCIRHPDAHRLDMKTFINRPIPRLLRYDLLLKGVLEVTPEGHEDIEAIPQVLDVIKALGKETEPGVASAELKVELWRYNSNLIFKQGESVDMDLLDENRSLIHTGKLLRQPETGFEWNGWSELFVLLFDNYLVMTKPKEKDGVTKYHVNRRPIPLDLLTLANFTDPATQRSTGILRGLRGGERGDRHGDQTTMTPQSASTPDSAGDSRAVYPCTLHHSGRLGGLYTLYAETQQARAEWKQKLQEATGLRKIVQESNKVFEVETLSADTFLIPSMISAGPNPSWNLENSFTGKVTCSVPFTTADGRGLVAIGCAEGVWIGFRHDSRSMRRVLHLKMVSQCAMLEDFGIFLVLADKSLFAYHIEALVPSSPHNVNASQTPQKLNGTKDVHFFSVGSLGGRTLVIYMKKKNLDSVFRVLEPVVGKINERAKAPASFGSRLGLRPQRSEWFRVYRDFFLPSESFDLIFLKAKIAILCTKGFEIMDLTDFKSVTIPQRDDPRLEKLAKRCESCRPMGMFRSNDDEFLLVYDEFGLYVDKHGDPSRSTGTIEWEGTAERVAMHSPYILLFDSRFIEIRHIETGRLAQIIIGDDVRCLWDGRGVSTPVVTPGPEWQDHVAQEAQVHAVMNATEPSAQPGLSRPARAVAQHVFELIPTIPLYLPGSLASPSNPTYFPQSSSPPHSPHLSPTSWRS